MPALLRALPALASKLGPCLDDALQVSAHLLPCNCLLCGRLHYGAYDLCRDCEAELPFITRACQRCGLALQCDNTYCGRCVLSPPAVDHCFSLFHYRPPIDKLISGLKFHERFDFGLCLAHLLGQSITARYAEDRLPQLIVPVPLHRFRQRRRGFNQSLEIARRVAHHSSVPLAPEMVQRRKPTLAQTSLHSVSARRRNLAGAFTVDTAAMPAGITHIAIVDDVITTMATVNALARCLRQAGIQHIEAWSIARASR